MKQLIQSIKSFEGLRLFAFGFVFLFMTHSYAEIFYYTNHYENLIRQHDTETNITVDILTQGDGLKNPGPIRVSKDYIYWMDETADFSNEWILKKANLDGSNITVLRTGINAFSPRLELRDGGIYIYDSEVELESQPLVTAKAIALIGRNGESHCKLNSASNLINLTKGARKLYYCAGNEIWSIDPRFSIYGSNNYDPTQQILLFSGEQNIYGLFVYKKYIYFTQAGGFYRIPIGGTNASSEKISSFPNLQYFLRVKNGKLYAAYNAQLISYDLDAPIIENTAQVIYVEEGNTNNYIRSFDIYPEPAIHNDFDGDGISDKALYQASNGTWSVDGSSGEFFREKFGFIGTTPVPHDYDGDGVTDLGLYHAATGKWYLLMSTNGFYSTSFGYPNTIPTPGDYDGDGCADLALFDPKIGRWYFRKSTEGFMKEDFGYSRTIPVGTQTEPFTR